MKNIVGKSTTKGQEVKTH